MEGEASGRRRSFGDRHSSLLDHYERLSLQVQLDQAILGRNFSMPGTIRLLDPSALIAPPSSSNSLSRSLKKLVSRVFRTKARPEKDHQNLEDHQLWGNIFRGHTCSKRRQ
ncbi:hypothetical protein AMTR_s00077p00088270 [Amborella trichopoda]|uniref:Uncharacterized protein n=1 Tax=Amborella trichopoda TaxID=13333 RepID=W1PAZ3_AMBTC|nr:hypothetical protein AMTR_s00077p00088270 [Amborella trichopoda]